MFEFVFCSKNSKKKIYFYLSESAICYSEIFFFSKSQNSGAGIHQSELTTRCSEFF